MKQSIAPIPTQEPTAAAVRSRVKLLAAYVLCATIWGTTWFSIRVSIGPDGFTPFVGAALRFTVAVAIFAAVWAIFARRFTIPTGKQICWVSLAGIFSGLSYGLLYAAEQSVSGGLAAVINATQPLMAATLAMATRTERMTRGTVLGSLLAIAGVAAVFHDRLQVSHDQAVAVAMLIAVCLLAASSNVVLKRHASALPALVANTIFFTATTVLLWIGAALTHQLTIPKAIPAGPVAALLYLSIFGTVLAFFCFFYLMKHVRLSTIMTLAFVTPIIALIVDAFFEKHAVLRPETYVGIGLVLLGVAATVAMKIKERQTH